MRSAERVLLVCVLIAVCIGSSPAQGVGRVPGATDHKSEVAGPKIVVTPRAITIVEPGTSIAGLNQWFPPIPHQHSPDVAGVDVVAPIQHALGLEIPDSIKQYWVNRSSSMHYDPSSFAASVDWSANDSPVKYQGGCGSCWAFAAVALIENLSNQTDLSEQVVLACSGGGTCIGGNYVSALNYIRDAGIPDESCYPYTAKDGYCGSKCQNPAFLVQATQIASDLWGGTPTVEDLKAALQNGPVVVGIHVYTDFDSYTSGIYHHATGTYRGGHAVLLVGYNDTDQCFKVKNSWGTYWGEGGYFRISYLDVTNDVKFGEYGAQASGVHTHQLSSNVQIQNQGTSYLVVSSMSNDRSWLSLNPSTGSFSIEVGGSQTVSIEVLWSLVPPMQDSSVVTFASNDSSQPIVTVQVTAIKRNISVLTIAPSDRQVGPTSGTTAFSVSNAGAGTMSYTAAATSGGTWLSISSGASGGNSGSIVAEYTANSSGTTSRTGVITVTAAGATGSPRLATVTQAAPVPVLHVSPTTWYAPGDGQSNASCSVTNAGDGTAISYTVVSNATWLTASASEGTTPATLGLAVVPNGSGSTRTAIVTITAISPSGVQDTPRMVIVRQDPLWVDVTIQTVPSGRTFRVFDNIYTAPQTFSWLANSSHMFIAPSPQSGGTGVQYIYGAWSDSGAMSHRVTTPMINATYTVSFSTQYYLTMNVGGGGTISPLSGWFANGEVVPILATPTGDNTFAGWTGTGGGSYSGFDASASITMNGPITQFATFSDPGTTTGTLGVSVKNAVDEWSIAGDLRVELYNSVNQKIAEKSISSAVSLSFANVPVGSGYSYKVFHTPEVPSTMLGEQYWGKRTNISIVANQVTNNVLRRNMPYEPAYWVYDSVTNQRITCAVPVGRTLKIVQELINPNLPEAQPQSVCGRMYISLGNAGSSVFSDSSAFQSYAVGSTRNVTYYFVPESVGTYNVAGATVTLIDGMPLCTDGDRYRPTFSVQTASTGILQITASNAEDWGGMGDQGLVEVYNSSSILIHSGKTDTNSVIQCKDLAAGSGYWYRVYKISTLHPSGYANEFWGEKHDIVIFPGQTTFEAFKRNVPYVHHITVFDASSNQQVSAPVSVGTLLRVDLVVKNPDVAGGVDRLAQVRLILDRDKRSPYDFIDSSLFLMIGKATTVTRSLFFQPSVAGSYSHSEGVVTLLSGSPQLCDGDGWETVLTVTPAPPVPPLLVSPIDSASGLSTNPTFVWNEAAGALTYHLQVSTRSTFDTLIADHTGIQGLTQKVTGLAVGQKYCWRVRGANDEGSSGWSAVRSFTTATEFVTVVVMTNPPDLAFSVDGVVYHDSLAQVWGRGSPHTIAASASQTAGAGMQYAWNRWSDGGPIDHSVNPSKDTTYTVFFNAQYKLTMTAAAGGSVSPSSGWKKSGEAVNILAIPAAGYGFAEWHGTGNGQYSGVSPAATITIYSPISEVASFAEVSQIPRPVSPNHMVAGLDTPVTVRWTRPAGATSFHLQVGGDSTFTVGLILPDYPTVDTFVVLRSLSFLTSYWWRVNAYNAAIGVSGYSQAWEFSTGLPLPGVVTLLEPLLQSVVNADTLRMRWGSTGPFVDRYWLEYGIDSVFTVKAIDSILTDTTTVIRSMAKNMEHFWRVRAHNLTGWGPYSSKGHFLRSLTSAEEQLEGVPATWVLMQNYPNPFNPNTTIQFGIPWRSQVRVTVWNTLGEQVAQLIDGELEGGYHTVRFEAANLSSGLYFYRMQSERFNQTRKLVFLR